MSRVYLNNKKTGVTYVYECVSFWDKEKKKPASKRTCIGKLDPITKQVIPSKRLSSSTESQPNLSKGEVTASVKSVGAGIFSRSDQ